MKTKIKVGLFMVVLSVLGCSDNVTPQNYGPDEPVNFQIFYNQLSPYGAWVNYPTYGYVWIPSVSVGFSPYVTNGYWLYTNYGWTWYSSYAWGWAPFHYGRWHFDLGYGWMWVPDTFWGPGWVAWRMGGGYCGWAPMGPNISVNVIISGGHQIAHEHWTFVRDRDFTNRDIEHNRVERSRNSTLMESAVPVNRTREERNVVYMPGPDKNDVQLATNRSVTEMKIAPSNTPRKSRVNNDQLELYRPTIKNESAPASPKRSYNLNEIKKQSERSVPRRQPTVTPPANPPRSRQPAPVYRDQQRPRDIIKSPPATKPRKRGGN